MPTTPARSFRRRPCARPFLDAATTAATARPSVPARALPDGSSDPSGDDAALEDAVPRDRVPPPASTVARLGAPPPPRAALPPGVAALAPGARVGPGGRYTVLEVLGAGANAVAYRARDARRDGEEVALKALSLRSLRDWKQLDLFKREAETLRGLSHPSIPALLDYFEEDSPDDRAFYIAQRAAPRGCATLAQMVAGGGGGGGSGGANGGGNGGASGNGNENGKENGNENGNGGGGGVESGPPPPGRPTDAEVLRIARELLGVLGYLSGLRPPVVHRDIKPDNVVIEGGQWGGKVLVVDFGGSVAAAASPSSSPSASSALGGVEVLSGGSAAPPPLGSTVVGTYGYMAPEQFRGEASPASDLYALGATLLFLATGGRPPSSFPQDGRMRVDLSAASRSLGPEVAELLDGLLEPLPEDRMTAAEALEVASPSPPPSRSRAQRRRSGRGQQQQQQQSQSSSQRRQAEPEQMMVRLPDGSLLPVTAVSQRRTAGGGDGGSLARGARRPAGTRVRLERTGGRLDLEIPPEGLGGQSVGTGLFALAWNGFVAFWTFSALASGGVAFALFSAPFWFAGAQLAQQALSGAFSRERLALGRRRFRLSQELATADGRSGAARFLGRAAGGAAGAREVEGDLMDLTGARLVTTMVVNGVPRTAVELVEGVRKHRFAEALDPAEQRWIVAEVDAFLEGRRGRAVEERDFPAADPAEVVLHDDYDYGAGGMGRGGGGGGGGGFFGRGDGDPFTSNGARGDPFFDRDQFWGDRR